MKPRISNPTLEFRDFTSVLIFLAIPLRPNLYQTRSG
jgi:hypothetical protein